MELKEEYKSREDEINKFLKSWDASDEHKPSVRLIDNGKFVCPYKESTTSP